MNPGSVSTVKTDAIVIGAGHNGLVCANYLAREGLRVLVLEARDVIGGACVSEELVPGGTFSSCSYIQMMLRREVVEDLELKKYGLVSVAPDMLEMGLWEDGDHVMLWRDIDRTLKSMERHNARDGANFMRFGTRLRRFGELTGALLMSDPPSVEELREVFEQAGEGELFNEFVMISAEDLLSRYFESDRLRGFMMFMGMVSTWGGPRTPGTAYVYGYHAQGEFEGNYGQYGLPQGGMGMISDALAKGLEAYGGSVRTGSLVRKVIVRDDRAVGVEMVSGEVIEADLVVSNADPKRSLQGFLDAGVLPPPVERKASQIDVRGSMARIHLLVDTLPDYVGFTPGKIGPQHQGLVIMGASPALYEKAWEAQKKGDFPDDFVIEALIPSVTHPGLVKRPGHHTISLGVQQLPFDLADGDWDSRKEEWADKVLEVYFRYAPNLRGKILGRHVITPRDLERVYNITGGNIFHSSMVGTENNFDKRPIEEAAHYRTPLQGYYLCGSGSHPGGGVSGAPGHNAAKRIIADREGRYDERLIREDAVMRSSTLANLVMSTSVGRKLGYSVARSSVFRKIAERLNKTK
ncbi:phytoene dehydrogenase [Agrobacterium arsenijevicii]|uniref:Pyridine nucleotide-disulfide oxidoreductase domain-containing protein 2 n=2 Tax=Agrobacterium TaxID=357 RepID=A0A4D7Z2N3_AGRTU|nr:NAD(P)/FAD-dependent oxidoreductase [Agrobacterium tumefaciens]KJF70836.1 phytoene dehydrogenase [Agrobacterium arsenijevicii]QCL98172.1 NAD(P)/FAD-dependent oxidoreductase [Agrobacterium tumefaciens]